VFSSAGAPSEAATVKAGRTPRAGTFCDPGGARGAANRVLGFGPRANSELLEVSLRSSGAPPPVFAAKMLAHESGRHRRRRDATSANVIDDVQMGATCDCARRWTRGAGPERLIHNGYVVSVSFLAGMASH